MSITARMKAALLALLLFASPALAADPIKVGFSLGLTGANAPNGGQLLLALQIWRDDLNAKVACSDGRSRLYITTTRPIRRTRRRSIPS
jgi:ABC-type branched-subunit amino acid transport system substrate-binding protein